jgi:hypothetical protein
METRIQPQTAAQHIFGVQFGNRQILNERPTSMRSSDPAQDAAGFRAYKRALRDQKRIIKSVTR